MLESPVEQKRHLRTSQLDEGEGCSQETKIELRNKLRNVRKS